MLTPSAQRRPPQPLNTNLNQKEEVMEFGIRFRGTKKEANVYCFPKNSRIDALLEVIILKALATQVQFTEEEAILLQEKLHEALVRARSLEPLN